MMSEEPWGDIPLFREIQKILSSSSGPINLEIARQVGIAVGTQGLAEGQAAKEEGAIYLEAAHTAESVLSSYTGLRLEKPVLPRLITRTEWVQSTLDDWKWLLEQLSGKFAGGIDVPEEGLPAPMQTLMGQVVPLLLGLQTGTLVGHLSRESLGRYDPPIPRDDDGQLFLTVPNATALASAYGFESKPFLSWLALQDVARHLVMTGVPWVDRYFRSLLTDLIASIEIEPGDLEQRIMEMQTKGIESLQEDIGAGQAFPIASTERYHAALRRVRSFLALLQGYAGHISSVVAPEMVGDTARIQEGMARHHASPSQGKQVLAAILGISVDREMEQAGTTFCAAVVKMKGIKALTRLWEAPDNLPALQEIKDPFEWMDRVLE